LNQNARVDFTLTIGNVSQTVDVTAAAPVLQTQSTQLGTVIDARTNTQLPLASRNYVQLTLLAPGSVHPDPQGFARRRELCRSKTTAASSSLPNLNQTFGIPGVPSNILTGMTFPANSFMSNVGNSDFYQLFADTSFNMKTRSFSPKAHTRCASVSKVSASASIRSIPEITDWPARLPLTGNLAGAARAISYSAYHLRSEPERTGARGDGAQTFLLLSFRTTGE
jgi:hypothetical protein